MAKPLELSKAVGLGGHSRLSKLMGIRGVAAVQQSTIVDKILLSTVSNGSHIHLILSSKALYEQTMKWNTLCSVPWGWAVF